MFIGQLAVDGMVAYSPWEAREGDKVIFLCNMIDLSDIASLAIDVQHKNADEADGSATTAGSFTNITAAGVATKEITAGMKQVWRYKFTVDTTEVPAAGTLDWVIFDMLSPSWRAN